jgi:hypothetical protein
MKNKRKIKMGMAKEIINSVVEKNSAFPIELYAENPSTERMISQSHHCLKRCIS